MTPFSVGRLLRPLALPFLGVLLFVQPLSADDFRPEWRVRVWKTEDGLAGNNVTGMAEDDEGFLWLVAGSRLARFDGVTLEDFSTAGLPAEQANRLRTVCRLRNGDLALLTQDGLLVRAGDGRVQTIAATLRGNRAEALVEDERGGLLIAYQYGAVARWRDGRLEQLDETHGLPASRARCFLAVDRDGVVWFSKAGVVGVFRDDRFEGLFRLPDPAIRLASAREGGLWLGAGLKLLRHREGADPQEIGRVPAANPEATITFVLEDREGAVWVGTSIGGLYRFDGRSFDTVGVSHREIVGLHEDREGSLWVATSGGGVNRVQPRYVRIEGEETGLPFRAVQAVCEDPSGTVWAITQDGLPVVRGPGGWRNVFGAGEGFSAEATCIAADPAGAIWIGTRNHRLYRWHQGRLDSWGKADGLLSPFARALHVDGAGDLWIAGGRPASLQRLRKGRLYKEIADQLGIGLGTVRTHQRRIYEKLHVQSRTEATVKFLRWGA